MNSFSADHVRDLHTMLLVLNAGQTCIIQPLHSGSEAERTHTQLTLQKPPGTSAAYTEFVNQRSIMGSSVAQCQRALSRKNVTRLHLSAYRIVHDQGVGSRPLSCVPPMSPAVAPGSRRRMSDPANTGFMRGERKP